MPLRGGPPETMVSPAPPAGVGGLVVDRGILYWGELTTSIRASALAGGEPWTLASGFMYPALLRVDDLHRYFTTGGWGPNNYSRQAVSLAGGELVELAHEDYGFTSLALVDGTLYWTPVLGRSPSLPPPAYRRLRVPDGAAADVATTGCPSLLVADGSGVYWFAWRGPEDGLGGWLMRRPLDGGPDHEPLDVD